MFDFHISLAADFDDIQMPLESLQFPDPSVDQINFTGSPQNVVDLP